MDWNAIFRNAWKLAALLVIPLFVIGVLLIYRSASRSSKSGVSIRAQLTESQLKLWPNGRVTYRIDPELDRVRGLIKKAIKGIEDNTCVRFIDKATSSERNWINFQQDDSDCIYPETVGMSEKAKQGQTIYLSSDCLSSGQIQRYLGLVLGLGFEQNRPDSAKYIMQLPGPGCPNSPSSIVNASQQFGISQLYHPAAADIFFDYLSHMLVNKTCVRPVASAAAPDNSGMGTRLKPEHLNFLSLGSSDDEYGGTLSILDIEKLNAVYKCSGCNSYRFRPLNSVAEQLEPFESFNPVLGGADIDGQPLYICRVYHHGSLLIGKLKVNAHENICWISDTVGSKEFLFRKNFEVLTNPENVKLSWRQVDRSSFPNNSIIGGRLANRRSVYIGRCKLSRSNFVSVIPGYFQPGSEHLSVPFGNQAFNCAPYEVLVCDE